MDKVGHLCQVALSGLFRHSIHCSCIIVQQGWVVVDLGLSKFPHSVWIPRVCGTASPSHPGAADCESIFMHCVVLCPAVRWWLSQAVPKLMCLVCNTVDRLFCTVKVKFSVADQ